MYEDDQLPVPDEFEFPFTPYSIQLDFMQKLYEVIEQKKLGIFESPTGTGKSLSIICGAIRWLKDHNQNERDSLQKKIQELEDQKKITSDSDSTDWIKSQAEVIKLTREINELKFKQAKITDYDKKIASIGENSKRRANVKYKKKVEEAPVEEAVEDEDVLLEEVAEKEESDREEEAADGYKPTKIIICSRTHSQLSQFIGEISRSPFGKNVRVASLASRQTYCLNSAVLGLKSSALINERCLDLQKSAKKQSKTDPDGRVLKRQRGAGCQCQFYKQANIEELKDSILSEVQDIEDLIRSGRGANACPYYASRLSVQDAEIVLVPYNTILHKATREANGIDVRDNVLIIDEAHNLLEAMAQMHNSEISFNQVQQALQHVLAYKQRFNKQFSAKNLLFLNQLTFVLTKFQQLFETHSETDSRTFTVPSFVLKAQIDHYNMFKLVQFCKESRIAQKIRSYSLKYPPADQPTLKTPKQGLKQFLSSIENTKKVQTVEVGKKTEEVKPPPNVGNPLLPIISFLETLTYSSADGRIFLHFNEEKGKSRLQYLLLNPVEHFSDIVLNARAVIVAGGTMQPIAEFKQRLFINSGASPARVVHFSCDHIVRPENILPIIVTSAPKGGKLLFNFEQRHKMADCVKSVLAAACSSIPGGVVAFFPSYSYEAWVWEQVKAVDFKRPVFREPQGAGLVEGVLRRYADAVRRPPRGGALLLSVVGGKLSEGLNFSDDLGRCVIVFGLPYANVKAPDLREKMGYLDRREGAGSGGRFYENLCMKAVNQSIGRAVRHRDDYACILLVDERFARPATKKALPGWIQRSLKVCDFFESFTNVKQFFKDRATTTGSIN